MTEGRSRADRETKKGLYRFRKEEKIRSRSDFVRIAQEGRKVQGGHFRLAVCRNSFSYPRLGITVGRRVGTAVTRNRLKRLVREFFRLHKELFPGSADAVITAREGAAGLTFRQVAAELKGLLRAIVSD